MILCAEPHEVNGDGHALARLSEPHSADLRKSGLSHQQIVACGFYSVLAPATVQRLLNWRRNAGELGDCLAIPFFDAEGKPTGYVRLKPDLPRKGKDGKSIKYES